MDPIGASTSWRCYGYDNSWVVIDGAAVESVSGGGLWGGAVERAARPCHEGQARACFARAILYSSSCANASGGDPGGR